MEGVGVGVGVAGNGDVGGEKSGALNRRDGKTSKKIAHTKNTTNNNGICDNSGREGTRRVLAHGFEHIFQPTVNHALR